MLTRRGKAFAVPIAVLDAPFYPLELGIADDAADFIIPFRPVRIRLAVRVACINDSAIYLCHLSAE